MDNSKKLTIQGTQEEDKHYKSHHYELTKTNNVHKTGTVLQTTGGSENP